MIPRSIPVLCYHDVGTPGGHPAELFEAHLQEIVRSGWRTLSCAELLAVLTGKTPVPERSLMLTFDDCHVSMWTEVAPRLRRLGLHGVFFAITDFLGQGPARTPSQCPAPAKLSHGLRLALRQQDFSHFLRASEVRALVEDFGFEVHNHTARHQGCFISPVPTGTVGQGCHWAVAGIYRTEDPRYPVFALGSAYAYDGFWPEELPHAVRLTRRSPETRATDCLAELVRSREVIQEVTGNTAVWLCWPWGHFDAPSTQAARASGHAGAFTLERGPNAPGTDPFRVQRIGVGRRKSVGWLRRRLAMHATTWGARLFGKRFRNVPPDPDLHSFEVPLA